MFYRMEWNGMFLSTQAADMQHSVTVETCAEDNIRNTCLLSVYLFVCLLALSLITACTLTCCVFALHHAASCVVYKNKLKQFVDHSNTKAATADNDEK